jgi:hypothetical protein
MGENIAWFLLVKMIFGLSGRTIFAILLFFVGCWVYIEWGGFITILAVIGVFILGIIIRAILFSLPSGVYPTFKGK